MAIKRDTGAILKQMIWIVAGIGVLIGLVSFAPVISHGG
jgi:hypothetical protein